MNLGTARPTVIKNPNFNEHGETIHFPLLDTHESVNLSIRKYSVGGPWSKLDLKLFYIDSRLTRRLLIECPFNIVRYSYSELVNTCINTLVHDERVPLLK